MNQVVNDVSLETANGMVNLDDALHVYMVQEKLKKFIDPALVEKVLYEKGDKEERSDVTKKELEKGELKYISGTKNPQQFSPTGEKPATKELDDKGNLVAVGKGDGEDETGATNSMYKDGDWPGVETPQQSSDLTKPPEQYDDESIAAVSRSDDVQDGDADVPRSDNENKKANDMADKLDRITGEIIYDPKDDRAACESVIAKIRTGEQPTPDELKAFGKYFRIKVSTTNEVAIYYANGGKDAIGDFRQGVRGKISMGSSGPANILRRRLEAMGFPGADATTTSGKVPAKIKSKDLTLNKISGRDPKKHTIEKDYDKNPDSPYVTPEEYDEWISQSGNEMPIKGKKEKVAAFNKRMEAWLDRRPKRKVMSVTVGGRVLNRQEIPDRKELIAEDFVREVRKKNPDMSEEEAQREADRTIAALNRFNDQIDTWDAFDEFDEVQIIEDQDTSTPEGRDRLVKEGPIAAAEHLERVIGEGNVSDAERKILDRMKALGTAEPPLSAEEYEKQWLQLLADMQKIPSIAKGVPDLAELAALTIFAKKGYDVVGPASETMAVSDLIILPPNDADTTGMTAEEIANMSGGVLGFIEMTGGHSVKWKGGAASGALAKIEQANFKDPKTKGHLLRMVELHNNFMGLNDSRNKNAPGLTAKRIEDGKKELDTIEEHAKKLGLKTPFARTWVGKNPEGHLYPPGDESRSPKTWSETTVSDWQGKKSLPADCGQTEIPGCLKDDNKTLLHNSLEQYCRAGLMLAAMHNIDLDYQQYQNANLKGDGMELTNGITSVNYMKFQENPGFDFTQRSDGQWIVRPNSTFAGNLKKHEK